MPLELGDLQILARDRRRVVGGLGAGESQLSLDTNSSVSFGRQCRSQRFDVFVLRIHAPMESQAAVRRSHKTRLSSTFRTECVNRVTPVDAGQKVGELRGRDGDRVLLGRTRRRGWYWHARRPDDMTWSQPAASFPNILVCRRARRRKGRCAPHGGGLWPSLTSAVRGRPSNRRSGRRDGPFRSNKEMGHGPDLAGFVHPIGNGEISA